MNSQFWPVKRFPQAFHDAFAAGGAVLMEQDLPWTLVSTRIRWYHFLRAKGENQPWKADIHGPALILRRLDKRDRIGPIRAALAGIKTPAPGVDK